MPQACSSVTPCRSWNARIIDGGTAAPPTTQVRRLLTALRAYEELAGHVRGALTNGLTRDEIVEAIIQTTGYCVVSVPEGTARWSIGAGPSSATPCTVTGGGKPEGSHTNAR
ncbi:carboxymuconolactone decarboxylase family protein [Nocardia cyriacigeorgica]|uniref:Carboxymuconolactone decarboxylase family protein n=1 Tax=Nocardia cyriacigeorgica TaxID=135487 RepID=A0A6P1D2W3_9NOCA|nr:carboxymuconolactone decarboxylase family protein [Nocardia cyriacigeorgica]NEW43303.1 carboxymuconolactone decarboxylase family protein [Nocardia cyriacigeorgica]NEW55004.1 carboxymuconolactone decarboxylase family protein [Nocardia cyriacigeorgica]